MKKLLLFIAIGTFILSSCSATNKMYLSVKEPAKVPLRNSIKKIGVIDRSSIPQENDKVNKIDQILTLEGKELDSLGRIRQIESVKNKILNNKEIESVKIIQVNDLLNVNPMGFGVALDQTTVKKLCTEHQVDAIVSLEYFDTDARATFNVNNYETTGPLGVKIPMVEQIVNIYTDVKSGWRIYDSSYVEPIDQSTYKIPLVNTGRGISPMVAFNTIKNRKSQVLQECNRIGVSEATRMQAFYVRVSRDYYVRGSNRFKIGQRMAQTGNWDQAREQWKMELTNPKAKIAGRAHYNMAISSEINGHIDDAIDFASKGYELYNNKLCLRYVNILRARKQRLMRAEELKQ